MPPKRGKKKNKDDDFEDDDKLQSKWANLLQQNNEDDEGDAEQIYNKPNKAVFDYDFKPPKVVHRDKYADLTPEEKEELEKKREKAKIDKAEKQKIKKEKKQERKKAIEINKAKQQIEKEKEAEEEKKVQEQIQKNKKNKENHLIIPLGLLIFLILMVVLQYNKEIHERLAKFKIDEQENLYQILQSDEGATDTQIKSKYKKLVLKYHPDRNPGCQNCQQKFDKIMKAWQVLGDSEKRKSYDQNNGYVSQIKSSSITLTPRNYNYLVEEGRNVWMVQVYDSTNQYSRYFSQFWEELAENYGDVIKFGRIDVWRQEDMLSYIPYRFQIFPALYTYDHGYSQICDVDQRSPLGGMKRCIDQIFQKDQLTLINNQPTKQEIEASFANNKVPIYLTGRLRANMRVKAINKMFSKEYDFFYMNTSSTKREAKVYLRGKNEAEIFEFGQNSKKTFENYKNFLQRYVILEFSVCSFLNEFEDRKCAILLNESRLQQGRQAMPLSRQMNIPLVYINDYQQKISLGAEKIKNITGMNENFDIGLYLNGRMDLGYFNDAEELIPEQGELIEMSCRVYSWKQKIFNFIDAVLEKTGMIN